MNLINVDVTVLHYEGRPLQCRYFIDSFCSKDRRTESNLFVGGDARTFIDGGGVLVGVASVICECHTAPLRFKRKYGL